MEKENPQAILDAPQFPGGEERNESAKDDDRPSKQAVDAYVVKRSKEIFSAAASTPIAITRPEQEFFNRDLAPIKA